MLNLYKQTPKTSRSVTELLQMPNLVPLSKAKAVWVIFHAVTFVVTLGQRVVLPGDF